MVHAKQQRHTHTHTFTYILRNVANNAEELYDDMQRHQRYNWATTAAGGKRPSVEFQIKPIIISCFVVMFKVVQKNYFFI